jgi:hypothetical protein
MTSTISKVTIDTKHPLWQELCEYTKDKLYGTKLTVRNWPEYVIKFTRDQVAGFVDICFDVQVYKKRIVLGIINASKYYKGDKFSQITTRLDELIELWNYDYEDIDCIRMCIDFSDSNYLLIKYFSDNGAQVNKKHAEGISYANMNVLNLLLDKGLDPDDAFRDIIEGMRYEYPEVFEQLHLFAKLNTDMISHILEIGAKPLNDDLSGAASGDDNLKGSYDELYTDMETLDIDVEDDAQEPAESRFEGDE